MQPFYYFLCDWLQFNVVIFLLVALILVYCSSHSHLKNKSSSTTWSWDLINHCIPRETIQSDPILHYNKGFSINFVVARHYGIKVWHRCQIMLMMFDNLRIVLWILVCFFLCLLILFSLVFQCMTKTSYNDLFLQILWANMAINF